MKISQYVIIRKYGNNSWPKYSRRMTAGSPALQSNEVAVKVTLELPDEIFTKPTFQANITVPKEAVSAPVIEAEVIDNVQKIIKQNLGFDVKLEVVEKETKKGKK